MVVSFQSVEIIALAPFQEKPLGDFLIAGNSGMLETNEWGLADLSRAVLGVRVYGSAAISFCQDFIRAFC